MHTGFLPLCSASHDKLLKKIYSYNCSETDSYLSFLPRVVRDGINLDEARKIYTKSKETNILYDWRVRLVEFNQAKVA
jgi:hypothetical protein